LTPGDASPPVTRVRSRLAGPWDVVLGVWVLIVAANAYYIVPAGVLPVLMDRLAIGPTTASLLVSVMFGTQVVVGIPVGMALDRVNHRRAILVATLVLVAAYAWSWQAATEGAFWSLLVSRAVATPATAAIWTAGVNVSARGFSAARQATAVGVFTSGPPAGFALGLLTGPVVATRFGWPAVFAVYAVPAAVGCAAFWVASRRIDVSGTGTETPQAADFGRLLSDRPLWTVATMAFLGFSLYAFVTSWVPTYLTEELGFSLTRGGLFVALFPAIGIVARGGSGAVSDRLFARRRRPVALLAFGVSTPAVVLVALADTAALVLFGLLVAGLFVQLGLGLFYAQVRELADPSVAATAVAFATSMSTFGGFTAPLLGGLLIEHGGYGPAFGYAVAAALLGLLLAAVAPEPTG